MNLTKSAIIVPLFAIGGFVCADGAGPASPNPPDDFDLLYSTSFESPQDTAGWPKNVGMLFSTDVPPGGGDRSVQISGGCIHPHASIDILGPTEDSYLRIECWGKDLALGGGISLSRVTELERQVHIWVQDTAWAYYASGEVLFCPAGEKLRIEMASGGIVASAMLVDLVEVRVVR